MQAMYTAQKCGENLIYLKSKFSAWNIISMKGLNFESMKA